MRILFTPILFSLLAFILFFAGLGAVGFLGPDEPRYAGVAREMLRSGDYVTPRLFGSAWLEKPPLYYWLAALGFRLGVSETTARLPSAVFACLFLALWFWFARRRFGHRVATLGCILLASTVGWIGFSRAAAMDMLFSSTLCAALVFLALWFWENKPLQLYGFCALLGVATLAKGPLAVALAGLVTLGYVATFGEWRQLQRLLWTPALLVYFGVAAPWYLLCFQQNGYGFIEEFFLRHNWERFTSAAIGHPQPFWFYVPVLAAGIFPWTPLLLLPLLEIIRKGLRSILANRQTAFLFYWVALPFVFFSISRNKLPGYLLPLLPPLTLWIAHIVERNWPGQAAEPAEGKLSRNPRKDSLTEQLILWLVGLSSLLLLAIPVLCLLLPGSLAEGLRQALAASSPAHLWVEIWEGSIPFPVWLMLVGLIPVSFYLLRRRQLLAAFFVVLLGVGLGTATIVEYLSPAINRAASVRTVAQRLRSRGIRGADLATYRIHRNQSFGLSFYMDRELPEWSPDEETAAASFVIARQEELLPEGRFLILFPGPRLRLWALPTALRDLSP
ncbi:MAG: glycosyltransferase family 39 protein [Acidobacteria bacterium]|nr:glycosyltransferase family 39 protein [Acidobacteriota bacterium]